MSVQDRPTDERPTVSGPMDATPAAAEPAASPFFGGNPAVLGLPAFIAGSVALALVLVGYVPAAAVGASIPIIFAATGVGLLIATVWSAALGQSAVATIFGIFAGFWLSYAVLVLALLHNWVAVAVGATVRTQALFLITWLVVIVLLTLATLRLPAAFTALFVLVDAALAFVLIGTLNNSSSMLKVGGVIAFVFAALGAYLYYGAVSEATGGSGVPLGAPLVH